LKWPEKELWKAWIAAILWLILIAIESTDWLSSDNTSRILYPILHFLTGVDPVRFVTWNYYIRKVGHVCGYFGLSLLLYRAWHRTITFAERRRWSIRWARIAFIMTMLVACLDEWHQTFIPSRTGLVKDVLLDSAAALAAQVFVFFYLRGARSAADRAQVEELTSA